MHNSRRLFRVLFVICFSFVTASAMAKEPCGDPCALPIAWQAFNSFTTKVTEPDKSGYSLWRGRFDKESNDIQIDAEISDDGGTIKKGKLLLVGGRVLALQGPIAEPGYEIDALDAPVLELQLIVKILGRIFPNGPASIQSPQTLDYTDSKTGIQIATKSAGGMIQAPWHVVGKVAREAGGIQYDLTLTSTSATQDSDTNQRNVTTVSGTLSIVENARVDDRLELQDWQIFGVGAHSRKQKDSTIIDYGAAPESVTYKTVSDIRKKLADEDYPGESDPSRDFTGFWKTNCENAFGLQIMHYGSEGKYSVVFCGPGGCGNPDSEGRPTFITKDPHYRVISEDRLEIGGGDEWETYYRCTKDPHPVLKYKTP